MHRRCDRNRKRSKRRAICCPTHNCYIDSVSGKHSLFTCKAEHLQQRGVSRKNALLLLSSQTAVPLEGEWLEAFWCDQCQEKTWYHVKKKGDRIYELSVAPRDLWMQAVGLINPEGNPTVSEFTRRQSRMVGYGGMKDFRFVG